MPGLLEPLKWLDPFTYVDLYVMPAVNPGHDGRIELLVNVVSAFVFAFVLYNFVLAGILGTSTPLVIVYSGSMEPVLYRGDVVILTRAADIAVAEASVDFPLRGRALLDFAQPGFEPSAKFGVRQSSLEIGGKEIALDKSGPIVVYYSALQGEDIIHRAVLRLKAPDGDFLVTFGDNNPHVDEACPKEYTAKNCINPELVPVESLRGKHVFHIPIVGYVKLVIFDDLPRLLSGSAGQ